MISVKNLLLNIYPIFKLAYPEGAKFEIYYKGKVFLLSIEPTGQIYKYRPPGVRRRQFRRRQKKPGVTLKSKLCKSCGGVEIGLICVNAKCKTNNRQNA